jgi:nuclease S1
VRPTPRTGVLLVALLAAPAPARAWIDEGHVLIGALAERRLSPAARAMVREILGDGHLWDHDVALWADDHRDRTSAPWHYVDIPFATGRYDAPRDCPGGRCAVARIEWAAGVLRASDDPAQRLEALRWLVHAVGDLHQHRARPGLPPAGGGAGSDRGGADASLSGSLRAGRIVRRRGDVAD